MAFSFQDFADFSGGGESPDNSGNSGILSSLENIGVNFAAGAATVGLASLGRSTGTTATLSPYLYGGSIAQRPSQLPAIAARAQNNNTIVIVGVLLVGGLLLAVAFRRKG